MTSAVVLARRGEHWMITFEGRMNVLKARRGLDHLGRLLAAPGRELHVLELSASDVRAAHETPILDARAKAAYRARIAALRTAADASEAAGDLYRSERAHAEIAAVAAELARALGLGGRDRTMGTVADRARAAVTLAIRRAIEVVAAYEPVLAGHLDTAVKTGVFCAYRPDPSTTLVWRVEGA